MISVPHIGLGGELDEQFRCSRARCSDTALWAIQWRNPKIHTPERKKTWLACEPHLITLRDFLEARSFPLEVISVDALIAQAQESESDRDIAQ